LLGGSGVVTGLLGLIPNLQKYVMIGLAVLLALAVGYGLLERGNYEECKAGRIADAAASADEAHKAELKAKADADAREIAMMQDISNHRGIANDYREMIANAPPSTCAPSAAARAASRGARMLLSDPNPTVNAPAK
jgi:hypothetical protein